MAEEVVSLEWVLGCSTGSTSLSVFSLADEDSHTAASESKDDSEGGKRRASVSGDGASGKLFYISGNVGVLYDTRGRSQTLLRGHRNPIRACTVSPDAAVCVTACAGSGSSIILWTRDGTAIASIDSPHPSGTLALDMSLDGRFLASLGVPVQVAGGGDAAALTQDVCIWAIRRAPRVDAAGGDTARDTQRGELKSVLTWGDFNPAEEDVVVECVAAASVPITDPQHALAFSQAVDLPTVTGDASLGLPPQLLAYELASTGGSSVVFWCLFGELRVPHGASQSSAALHAVLPGGTRIQWQLVCAAGKLPGATGAALESQTSPPPQSARGGDAPTTESVAAPGLHGATAGATGASTSAPGGRRGAARRHARATGTAFIPPVSTGTFPVSAVTATEDGSLVLWALPAGSAAMAPPPSTLSSNVVHAALAAAGRLGAAARAVTAAGGAVSDIQPQSAFALAAIVKNAAKTVKLSRPANINISANKDAAAAAAAAMAAGSMFDPSMRVNTLRLSPCARYIVVGSEDGAVRVYDLHLRLLAWYEEMDAGGVTSVTFTPGTGELRTPHAVADASHSAMSVTSSSAVDAPSRRRHADATGSSDGASRESTSFGLADFIVATRRSLVVSMRSRSFGSQAVEERRGDVILEGPDAAVVGLAAYPDSPRLAVAVASGCIQVWHTETKQLLVVRELPAPEALMTEEDTLAALHAGPRMLHPTCIAIDAAARIITVGTAEGFVCILHATDLSDVQNPIPPARSDAGRAHLASSMSSTGGLTGTSPRASTAALGGTVRAVPVSASTSPITKIAISGDGLHIAAADDSRHVALYRFIRTRIRQVATGATSRLGLNTVGARGRNALKGLTVGAAAAAAASASGHRPKTWEMVDGDETGLEEVVTDSWIFVGRAQPHSQAITAIAFSPLINNVAAVEGFCGFEGDAWWTPSSSDTPAAAIARHQAAGISILSSVGADRRLILFDVGASSLEGGVVMVGDRDRTKVEQFSSPTCAVWYPTHAPLPDTEADATSAASCVLVANNHYKLRLFRHGGDDVRHAGGSTAARRAAMGLACRKTVLGPTFGGAISHMLPLTLTGGADATDTRTIGALAFATDDRVVGVMALPLTGTPVATVGVVGHPGPVTGLAASFDGMHMYSCGLDTTSSAAGGAGNGSVCIWRLHTDRLMQSVQDSGGPTALSPFLTLLEGGGDGKLYQDMCDFFSYAQIRSQGEASTARRRAGITLPLQELASVMRALGFYPTAFEIAALMNEVKALNAAAGVTGAAAEQVDLQTLIRCYVNHRPVVNVGRDDLLRALVTLATHVDPDRGRSGGGDAERVDAPVSWAGIAQLLSMRGERMAGAEIKTCLTALLGPGAAMDSEDYSPADIASKVLGFM